MLRVLPLLLLLATARAHADAPADVRATLEAYRTALLAGDGKAAAQLVDEETLAYYDRMKTMALTAPAKTVKKQPVMDRLMIVLLRHRLPPAELRAMSGEALFAHAVAGGWIGKNSVANIATGKVSVQGQTATIEILQGGKPMPFGFSFRLQKGRWRLDLLPILSLGSAAMAQIAKQQNMTEDALIVMLAEKVSGKPVRKDIWDPPGK